MELGKNNEINLIPQRKIRVLGKDIWDYVWLAIFIVPALILLFTIGVSFIMSFVMMFYVMIAGIICFTNVRDEKLRNLIFKWFVWLFKPKKINKKQLNAFKTIVKIENNNVFYKNNNNERVLSIYRIGGANFESFSKIESDKALEDLAKVFGNRSDFKIIACSIKTKLKKKIIINEFNNSKCEELGIKYDDLLKNLSSKNKEAMQIAYFLILDSNNVEENDNRYKLFLKSFIQAKLELQKSSSDEILQVLNQIWPNNTYGKDKEQILDIEVHKQFLEFHKPKIKAIINNKEKMLSANEYIGFKTIIGLPRIATTNYLSNIFNNKDWVVYVDTKYLPSNIARNSLANANRSLSGFMGTKFFKKKASEFEREYANAIKAEIKYISDSITTESHIYELRENLMIVMFKAHKIKDLKKKMGAFKHQIRDYNKDVSISDLNFMQLEAFGHTRLTDIDFLMYPKSWIDNFRNLKNKILGRKQEHNTSNVSSLIKNNYVNILNTSWAIGWPFINPINQYSDDYWFKGWSVVETGASMLNRPHFDNYWKVVDDGENSFSRIYLGKTGSGKTWSAKRDIIQDYLSGAYVFSIDPKGDYKKMCSALGGEEMLLGGKSDTSKAINVFDVLDIPTAVDEENPLTPLERTYQRTVLMLEKLFNLKSSREDEVYSSEINKILVEVYEKQCKFSNKTDFSKVKKSQMPIMDDFYKVAVKMAEKEKNNIEMTTLVKLFAPYSKTGAKSYLFNKHTTDVDWNKSRFFNINIQAIQNEKKNILSAFIIFLMQLAIEIGFKNKGKNRKFALVIDEFHTINNIDAVLETVSLFVKTARAFKGGAILIDQSLQVIEGEEMKLYKDVFEQVQYKFFFLVSEGDVKKISSILEDTKKPMSEYEREFLLRASRGECLAMTSSSKRFTLANDVSHWSTFLQEIKVEEGKS